MILRSKFLKSPYRQPIGSRKSGQRKRASHPFTEDLNLALPRKWNCTWSTPKSATPDAKGVVTPAKTQFIRPPAKLSNRGEVFEVGAQVEGLDFDHLGNTANPRLSPRLSFTMFRGLSPHSFSELVLIRLVDQLEIAPSMHIVDQSLTQKRFRWEAITSNERSQIRVFRAQFFRLVDFWNRVITECTN
jgi:hypothetical protein